jgi:hypothetical protein
MKMILAVKAHKAKCLKILTLARQSLEEESDKLLDTLSKISLDFASDEVVVNTTSPGQPCTPSPTDQGRRLQVFLTYHLLLIPVQVLHIASSRIAY